MKSESIKELASALAKVKFGEIGKTKNVKVAMKSGGSYNFQYAPLEDIMSAIRRPLAEQGLSLSQTVTKRPDGWAWVETMLMHSSGEWITSDAPIASRDGMTAQEMGSAITYARRYGVTLVGCLVADEDDDANMADGNQVTQVKPKGDQAPQQIEYTPSFGSGSQVQSPGVIVDQNLAMERLTPEVAKAIRDESAKISADFYTVGAKAATGSWNSFLKTAGEDEIDACWKLLDSKVRSAIKKVNESMDPATQA
jgi:hypothetical protein